MLGILLAILKFIGIFILGILLLSILIITVVLVSPLKYRIAGEKKEHTNGDFEAKWLFGLIRVKGKITYGNEPKITVKVLWFTVFGEKKQKKQKKKVRKKKPKPVPQRMKPGPTFATRQKADKAPADGIYMAENAQPAEDTPHIKPDAEIKPDTEIKLNTEAKQDTEIKLEEPYLEESYNAKETPLPPKPNVRRVKVSDIKERPIEPSTQKEEDPDDFFSGETMQENDTSLLDKLRFYFAKFQEIDDKKGIFLAAKKLLKRLIKGILPNQIALKATLGLGDPTNTGYLMGLVGILIAKFGNNINIKGDFTRLVAEDIEVKVKGKIVIGSFLYAIVAFGLAKPIRRILIKLWKGRKQNG